MLAQTLFVDSIIGAPGLNDGRRFRDPAPDIYAADTDPRSAVEKAGSARCTASMRAELAGH
jgi:hypothetical protein